MAATISSGSVSPVRRVTATVVGGVVLLAVWQYIGVAEVFGTTISPPTDVVDVFRNPTQRTQVTDAAFTTGREAIQGFVWGIGIALAFGILVTAVPVLRRGIDRLATIQSAIPFVAMAPILLASLDRETIPVGMAANTAFFSLYVAIVSGLHAGSPALHEVLTVFGGGRVTRLRFVQVPAAIPVIATGCKVAMPLAIVGAVIGEWFGVSQGIGPLLLQALRNYQMPLMWAASVAVVVVAMVLYGLMAFLERLALGRFGSGT